MHTLFYKTTWLWVQRFLFSGDSHQFIIYQMEIKNIIYHNSNIIYHTWKSRKRIWKLHIKAKTWMKRGWIAFIMRLYNITKLSILTNQIGPVSSKLISNCMFTRSLVVVFKISNSEILTIYYLQNIICRLTQYF